MEMGRRGTHSHQEEIAGGEEEFSSKEAKMTEKLLIDGDSLTVDEAYGVAVERLRVGLAPKARKRMLRTRAVVDAIVERNDVVYGVTTGFGKLSDVAIPPNRLAELQINLVRSHASGVGDILPEPEVRAMMLLRANVIAKGYSGARPELVDLLLDMLNADVYPPIPEQGSVGASGDLAPLAHLALSLIGEGTLIKGDREEPASSMLEQIGAKPVVLAPKEGITSSTAHRPTPRSRSSLSSAHVLFGVPRTSPARCLSKRCSALLSHSTSAFTTRADRRDRSARRRSFAIFSPTVSCASRTVTAIRGCRILIRCAACRRCTAPCSTRSTG